MTNIDLSNAATGNSIALSRYEFETDEIEVVRALLIGLASYGIASR